MSTPPTTSGVVGTQSSPNTTDKPIRIQLIRQPERTKFILNSVNPQTKLSDFQNIIAEATNLPVQRQLLFSGFPPKEIDAANTTISIKELGIKHGDTVEVRVLSEENLIKPEMQQGTKWEWPNTINSTTQGAFQRVEMPRDNSCLYHSIAYTAQNKSSGVEAAMKIREIAANLVASDPKKYNTVFLGSPNALYVDQIMNPNTWGGAIELLLLSTHFQTEIFAFDILNLREDIFGQNNDYKRRIFLLYSGDHYDAMSYNSSGTEQVVFSTKDEQAWVRARDYVESLHKEQSRQGKCTLQTSWRHNQNLKRNSANHAEKKRIEAAKIDEEKKHMNTKDMKEADAELQRAIDLSMNNGSGPENNTTTASSTTIGPREETKDNNLYNCPTCTFANPITVSACSACGTPSPFAPVTASRARSTSKTTPSTTSSTTSSNSNINTSSSSSASTEQWSCAACTSYNPATRIRCSVCGERNPLAPTGIEEEFGPTPGGGIGVDSDGVRMPIAQTQDTLIQPEPILPIFPMFPTSSATSSIVGFAGRPVVNLPAEALAAQEVRRKAIEEACKEPFNCPKCTLYNEPNSLACSACHEPHPAAQKFKSGGSTNNNNNNNNNNSSSSNSNSNTNNKKKWTSIFGGGTKAPRWQCDCCGTEQSPSLIRCKNCKNPNVALLAQQQQAGPDVCSIM